MEGVGVVAKDVVAPRTWRWVDLEEIFVGADRGTVGVVAASQGERAV